MVNGQNAIDLATSIIGNRCYKNIGSLGQIEIVLNDDRIYNGYICKWVSIAWIYDFSNVLKMIKILRTFEKLKGARVSVDVHYEDNKFDGCLDPREHEISFFI